MKLKGISFFITERRTNNEISIYRALGKEGIIFLKSIYWTDFQGNEYPEFFWRCLDDDSTINYPLVSKSQWRVLPKKDGVGNKGLHLIADLNDLIIDCSRKKLVLVLSNFKNLKIESRLQRLDLHYQSFSSKDKNSFGLIALPRKIKWEKWELN